MNEEVQNPPEMPAIWYVMCRDEKCGPITLQQLANMITDGSVTGRSLVWKTGMQEWLPAEQVSEVIPHFRNTRVADLIKDERFQQALNVTKQSSKNAFHAFMTFIVNPLGGLPGAYQSLGKAGALSVGIVFFVVFELCLFTSMRAGQWSGAGLVIWVKFLFCGAVPVASMMLGLAATRLIKKSDETWHADFFIATSYYLVWGLGLFLVGLLGVANFEIVLLIMIFSGYYSLYILLSGLTRVYKISESIAAFTLPAIQILSLWLTKVVILALLQSELSGIASSGVISPFRYML